MGPSPPGPFVNSRLAPHLLRICLSAAVLCYLCSCQCPVKLFKIRKGRHPCVRHIAPPFTNRFYATSCPPRFETGHSHSTFHHSCSAADRFTDSTLCEKMTSTSSTAASTSSSIIQHMLLLLFLPAALFGTAALGSPLFHDNQKHDDSGAELIPAASVSASSVSSDSLLPPGDQHDTLSDPFQQQRWLSVRPLLQEYARPKSEELGLLLQYLDTKRNVPSLLSDESGQPVGGSPLGTMRFGKRAASTSAMASPLGTMRFGKRAASPLGTMRFGKRQQLQELQQRQLYSFNSSPLGTMRFG